MSDCNSSKIWHIKFWADKNRTFSFFSFFREICFCDETLGIGLGEELSLIWRANSEPKRESWIGVGLNRYSNLGLKSNPDEQQKPIVLKPCLKNLPTLIPSSSSSSSSSSSYSYSYREREREREICWVQQSVQYEGSPPLPTITCCWKIQFWSASITLALIVFLLAKLINFFLHLHLHQQHKSTKTMRPICGMESVVLLHWRLTCSEIARIIDKDNAVAALWGINSSKRKRRRRIGRIKIEMQ